MVFFSRFLTSSNNLLLIVVFNSSILADELPAKGLRRILTCLVVNNNLFGKLVSSLEMPIIFDDSLKTTSV